MLHSIDANGKLISVSDYWLSNLGYTKEEVIGRSSSEFLTEASRKYAKEIILPEFYKTGICTNVEYDYVKKNGEIINVLLSAISEYDENGKFFRSLAVINDITKHKQAELLLKEKNEKIKAQNEDYKRLNEEFKKAKEHAEESDRLKTSFLQNMSHEIRTPMNAIYGFSGLLNDDDLDDDKRTSFINIIQSSSQQLLSIVTDILTISSLETKQETTNNKKVCINNIIIDLLAIFKQQAVNQNVSLFANQQLTDKQSEIFIDKTKLTQILTNLITNAFKFTHEGSIEFGYFLVGTGRDLSKIQFYVKDTGIGIKTELQEKIFERFQQADFSITKKYGGTGLGLAISKGLVELLGGKIWVESEIDKGSTFYFTIPYHPINEIETIEKSKKQYLKTILVAEDEVFNFLLIEQLLKNLGLKIIHAKDGQETVEICKSNPNIDLILMDIKMPIMDGHEAAKQIKKLRPDLPIIAQSAYALENEKEKFSGDCFDEYITKPIDVKELKSKFKKFIDEN